MKRKLFWRWILPIGASVLAGNYVFSNNISTKSSADSPADLPAARWRQALKHSMTAVKDKQLSIAAANLAYHATLTFFPAVLGLATIALLIFGPHSLLTGLSALRAFVPSAVYDLLHVQLSPLASSSHRNATVALVVTLAALLWTTSGGLQSLIQTINITYDVTESRSMIRLRVLALILSVALLILGATVLGLLLLQPAGLRELHAPNLIIVTFPILRWPLLIIVLSAVLSIIYRYAPNRQEPRWQWVSWGAGAATVLWLIGTVAFFVYAQNFGNFNPPIPRGLPRGSPLAEDSLKETLGFFQREIMFV